MIAAGVLTVETATNLTSVNYYPTIVQH